MVMLKKLAALAVLAALLAGAWLLFFKKSDLDIVKGRFERLSEEVSKPGSEGAAAAIMKSQAIGALFAERCELEIQGSQLSGVYSSSEIASHAFNARSRFQSVSLSFHELEVEVQGDSADARFTVMLSGLLSSGDSVREAREMAAKLKKTDGKWLFESFKVEEILKR